MNNSDEEVLWSARTHGKVLVKPAFIQLLLLATHVLVAVFVPSDTGWGFWDAWAHFTLHMIILAVELWYVIIPVAQWNTSRFTVTPHKATSSWGVLYRQSREVPLDSIVSVSVERGILDRIFGCGTIVLQDAASGFQPETGGAWNKRKDTTSRGGVRLVDIPNVFEVQKIIENARAKARKGQYNTP